MKLILLQGGVCWLSFLIGLTGFSSKLRAQPQAYVQGWGANQYGVLNVPSSNSSLTFVDAGAGHALGITTEGDVVGWGNNTYGQITLPPALDSATAVAAGFQHSLALTPDGTVIGWGSASLGQTDVPQGFLDVVEIAAGGFHSLARRADGTVVAWGWNTYGQTDIPEDLGPCRDIAAGDLFSIAVEQIGKVRVWGYSSAGDLAPPPELADVKAIAAGSTHCVALKEDGTVVTWGVGDAASTAIPPGSTEVVAVAAGRKHSVALRADGTAAAWGGNDQGQLDVPVGLTSVQAISAAADYTLALTPGPVILRQPQVETVALGGSFNSSVTAEGPGTLSYQWFRADQPISNQTNALLSIDPFELQDAGEYSVRVASGASSILSRSFSVPAKPLMVIQPANQAVFVSEPVRFECRAIGAQPLRFQWFRTNPVTGDFIPITGATNRVWDIQSTDTNDGGQYRVTVENEFGSVISEVASLQVVSKANPEFRAYATNAPYGGGIQLQTSGASASSSWEFNGYEFEKADDFLFWLDNLRPSHSGEYRLRTDTPAGPVYSEPVELSVQSGFRLGHAGHPLQVDVGDGFGSVSRFQWFRDGTTVAGATNSVLTIPSLQPEDAGSYSVDLTGTRTTRKVEAAEVVVLPQPAIGRVVQWGAENVGRPPSTLGNILGIAADSGSCWTLTADGELWQWGPEGNGSRRFRELEPYVSLSGSGADVAAISASGRVIDTVLARNPSPARDTNYFVQVAPGDDFVLGLRRDGKIFGWGYNHYGQLSIPSDLGPVRAVAAGAEHGLALLTDGTIRAWGSNSRGQLDIPAGLSDVNAIACGAYHNLALKNNGNLVAWGLNASGQTNVSNVKGPVSQIDAVGNSSMALFADGSIQVWGADEAGQQTPPADLEQVFELTGNAWSLYALVGSTSNPAILTQPVGGVREIGGSIPLTVEVRGPASLSYQWQKDGTELTGEEEPTLTLTDLQPGDEGDYRVIVRSAEGMTTSKPVTVRVNPKPFLTLPDTVGEVVPWGDSFNGVADVLDGWQRAVEVQTYGPRSAAFNASNTAMLYGGFGAPPQPVENLVQVAWYNGFEQRTIALHPNGNVDVLGDALPEDSVLYDELRDIDALRHVKQIDGDGTLFVALKTDGTIYHTGPEDWFAGVDDVVDVTVSDVSMVLLRSDSTVMEARTDPYEPGEIPFPEGLDGVRDIDAGQYHILALRTNGTVVAWGSNRSLQSNVPSEVTNAVDIAAGGRHSVALLPDHTIRSWGGVDPGSLLPPEGLTNVVRIAAGAKDELASGSKGDTLALVAGPIIDNPPENAVAELGGSTEFSVVAHAPNTIEYQWFHEDRLLTGANGPSLSLTNLQAADAGRYTVVLQIGGFINRATAELGLGDPPVIVRQPRSDPRVFEGESAQIQVEIDEEPDARYQWFFENEPIPGPASNVLKWEKVALADSGTYRVEIRTPLNRVVVSEEAKLTVLSAQPMGTVIEWGGGGDLTPPDGLSGVVDVAAGREHAVALHADGTVTVWGNPDNRQWEPPQDLRNVADVEAGVLHSLALLRNDRITGWGWNLHGEATPPRRSDFVSIAAGGMRNYAITSEGEVVGWGLLRDLIPPSVTNVTQLATSDDHMLALRQDGTLVGWGANDFGQTEFPPLTDVATFAAGGYHSAVVREDGTVTAFGNNLDGQSTVPEDLNGVVQVAVNHGRTLALKQDGTVVAWGRDDLATVPAGLTNAVKVVAGEFSNFAIVQTGSYILRQPEDQEVVRGQSALFYVNAVSREPVHYQWQKDGVNLTGETNQLLVLESPALDDAGDYRALISNSIGVTPSRTAELTVHPVPVFVSSPQDQIVPEGGPAQFQAEVEAETDYQLQWYLGGLAVPGATTTELNLTAVEPSQTGTYYLHAENEFGLVFASAELWVLSPPKEPLLEGGSALFKILGNPGPMESVAWFHDNQRLNVSDPFNLELTGLEPPGGTVRAEVQTDNGTRTSAAWSYTVHPKSPVFLEGPADQTAYFGDTVTLNAHAIGATPLAYQWLHNGESIPGATNAILRIAQADRLDSGQYTLRATNAHGTAESPPATLHLRLRPNVVAWGQNHNGELEVPQSLTNAVAIDASHHSLAIRTDGTVVGWGANESGQTDIPAGLPDLVEVAAGSNHSLALTRDGTVVAWGGNDHGQVEVPAELTNVVSIAAGSLHNLAVTEEGTVVGWGYNAYDQASPPPTLTDAAAVAATFEGSAALRTGGTVASWGSYTAIPQELDNVISLNGGPGRFLAIRQDQTLVGWGNGDVSDPELPRPVISADSGRWIVSQGNNTYLLSHKVAALTNGTVTVWDAEADGVFQPPPGLSNVVAVSAGRFHNLALTMAPQILQHPRGDSKSLGEDLALSVRAVGDEPYRYQWLFDGSPVPGQTNSSLTLNNLQIEDHGLYAVDVRGQNGRVTSRPASIEVVPNLPYFRTQPQNRSVSPGAPFSLQAAVLGQKPLHYQWRRNLLPIPGATNVTLTVTEMTEDLYGRYDLVASNPNGTTVSAPAVVSRDPATLVIDNHQGTRFGSWQAIQTWGQFGEDVYVIDPGFGLNHVEFNISLPWSGRWRVTTHAPPVSEASAKVQGAYWFSQGSQADLHLTPDSSNGWLLLAESDFSDQRPVTVQATDWAESDESPIAVDAIRFTSVTAPPVIYEQPASTDLEQGESLHLQVTASGAPPVSFQWTKDGEPIPGDQSRRLQIQSAEPSDSGSYQVLVTNPDGSVESRVAQVIVNLPTPLTWDKAKRTLSWEPGYLLQTATNAVGPYLTLPDAQSPFPIAIGQDRQRFYRLIEEPSE